MRVVAGAVVMAVGLVFGVNAFGADPELGKKVYAQKCAACHGADGKGNAKMEQSLKVKIPALTATTKTDAEIHRLLVEGKKPMPSFKTLSNEEMDAVMAYTKAMVNAGK
jgi:mono/diheme cytochrome c family protein